MKAGAGLVLALVVAAPVALAQSGEVEFASPAVRDVTPPGVTPAPSGEGPLIRVPPPPKPPEPPRWRRFFLPETIDAATFGVDGKTVQISGVTPPPVGHTCRRDDGSNWPCGRTALYSLRMFLRGRAVECYFPYVLEQAADITAPCRVGGTDLGRWLLIAGWAEPDALATEDYRHAAAAARCAGRGVWHGTTPPASCPLTDSSSDQFAGERLGDQHTRLGDAVDRDE